MFNTDISRTHLVLQKLSYSCILCKTQQCCCLKFTAFSLSKSVSLSKFLCSVSKFAFVPLLEIPWMQPDLIMRQSKFLIMLPCGILHMVSTSSTSFFCPFLLLCLYPMLYFIVGHKISYESSQVITYPNIH